MTLQEINHIPDEELFPELYKCCGSSRWAELMVQSRPFRDQNTLHLAAESCWDLCGEQDAREAFANHPQIGSTEELARKFGSTSHWAGEEQAAVKLAESQVISALEAGNKAYLEKFGFIFIVCATGKSAAEMLTLLVARLPHSPQEEMTIARAEQMKITLLRLQKLLAS
jgi:2-oxo-4-hydroxy-4-carboxy-5-ureidoimidazoline decarboxylase